MKIQIYSEDRFGKLTEDFATEKRQYCTYQLKNCKDLCVVIKGIEPEVHPNEIKEKLTEIGYAMKSASVIMSQNRISQPLFKVELNPEARKLGKKEI